MDGYLLTIQQQVNHLLQSMSWLDFTVVGLIVMFAVWGYCSGSMLQIMKLSGVFFALWLCSHYNYVVAEWIGDAAKGPVGRIASCLVVFVGGFVGWYMAVGLLGVLMGRVPPDHSDRMIGAILGGATGFLLCGGIGLIVQLYAADSNWLKKNINDSPAAKAGSSCVRFVCTVLPTGWRGRISGNGSSAQASSTDDLFEPLSASKDKKSKGTNKNMDPKMEPLSAEEAIPQKTDSEEKDKEPENGK